MDIRSVETVLESSLGKAKQPWRSKVHKFMCVKSAPFEISTLGCGREMG